MAIGRTFEEAFQKAIRMVDASLDGFGDTSGSIFQECNMEELDSQLREATDQRVMAIAIAYQRGYSIQRVWELTKIDKWFLAKLRHVLQIEIALSRYAGHELKEIGYEPMSAAKKNGFSDRQIARCLSATPEQRQIAQTTYSDGIVTGDERTGPKSPTNTDNTFPHPSSSSSQPTSPIKPPTALDVRQYRKSLGLTPFVKQIDTLSAEFPAQTNYLYMTYNGCEHDLTFTEHGVMVLGCGAYRIGSSCEFDWCAVSCLRTLRKHHYASIMVNFNPETVSTDYDECDRLYFEELSFEVVMDIYECETSSGIILSVGGQIPNNLAVPLHKAGVSILGTSAESIDRAEDREKFSELMDQIPCRPGTMEEAIFSRASRGVCRVGGISCVSTSLPMCCQVLQ